MGLLWQVQQTLARGGARLRGRRVSPPLVTWMSQQLPREYGFTDTDDQRRDRGKHFQEIAPSIPMFKEGMPRLIDWLDQISGRAKRCLGSSAPYRG